MAKRSLEIRTPEEQLPSSKDDVLTLKAIYSYFVKDPYAFEHFSARLVQMMDPNIIEIDVTRPSRDGGRDAVGQYRIGTEESSITVEFALEAKCYQPGRASVGTKETSRLISRLRHRQFGVLVTTSTVGLQAYREIRDDRHPVLILSGRDIVSILAREARGPAAVKRYLERNYHVS